MSQIAGTEPKDPQTIETRIRQIGTELLDEARDQRGGVLSKAFWSQKLIDWAMKDEAFKVQLFRFVDAFPTLKTPQQVHDHLTDYLSQPGVTTPPGLGLGMKAGGLLKGALARTVAGQITGMGQRFIAGTDAASALPKLRKLWSGGIGFSVDLLGEACVSNAEAQMYQRKYLDLITSLPRQVANWPANDQLETDHLGTVPRTNVSIKISSLFARCDPADFDGTIEGLMEALGPVLLAARENDVFINFDIEFFRLKDLTLELFMRCCEAIDFQAGLALQSYLRSGDDDARRIVEWAKRCGRQVTVRLVKGAYWDYETIEAEQMGWPVPVWSRKSETDACFERMTDTFIEAIPETTGQGGVKLAMGSHNIRSIAAGLAQLEQRGLPPSAVELQFLHGMADEIKAASVDRGLRVREYVPVGEMIPGMAYLVRRLLENTSNESWLRASFLDAADPETLLASPHGATAGSAEPDPGVERIERAPERHRLSPAVTGVGDGQPFFSEPLRDLTDAGQRERFSTAVNMARVPKVAIDATVQDADQAVGRAAAAFPGWRDTEPRRRADILTTAAAIMRRRRDELSGIEIREAGKPWREADADVCESIDFCEYYARMSVELFEPKRLGAFIGELDEVFYQPRGITVVISPWNFPLALCCGMTTASLATGNATIVKPSRQTPAIARVMCEILWEAGVPREVLQFIAGPGSTVGAALTRDPRVSMVAFTGSKDVGLDIIQAAGTTAPGQQHVKKVISEMGGKNAIIVDASADLDETVIGVRNSAFGYCGQKCSACSRVVVVDTAYDAFIAWPGVTAPTQNAGLGFGSKWNMGWMNDTLSFMRADPDDRPNQFKELTFPLMYAFSEQYTLPLSHDEVVHGKGSLWGKMPGDESEKAANLRLMLAHQFGHPGKKLLFMGAELGQIREWSHDRELDWDLLSEPFHAGIQAWIRSLNTLYRDHSALWNDSQSGFEWLDISDPKSGTASYLRKNGESRLAFILNFSNEPRTVTVYVPIEGTWKVELDSQSEMFGGAGSGPDTVEAVSGDRSDNSEMKIVVPGLTAIICSPAK